MTIYALHKNYQTHDGDGWSHWVESQVVSYHQTLEGIYGAIDKRLKEDVAEFMNLNESLIPFNGKEWFDERVSSMRLNEAIFAVGRNGEELELHNIYYEVAIEVEA